MWFRWIAAAFALAAATGATGVAPAVTPKPVLPPCSTPSKFDTSKWQTVRLGGASVSYLLPGYFMLDSTAAFSHGGRLWRSGKCEFSMALGIWGDGSFGRGYPGYSECEITLAGERWRLITLFDTHSQAYVALAVSAQRRDGLGPYTIALRGRSEDRSDQALFLAIFRTLRADTLRVRQGGQE